MDKGLRELLEEWRETRRQAIELLNDLADEDLRQMVDFWDSEHSLAFVLHRFEGHAREHLVQIEKIRRALGKEQTEVQRILRMAEAIRGEIEGTLIGLSDEDLDWRPAPEEWSIREVLQHLIERDRWRLGFICDIIKRKAEGSDS